jgi:hypothetical protein
VPRELKKPEHRRPIRTSPASRVATTDLYPKDLLVQAPLDCRGFRRIFIGIPFTKEIFLFHHFASTKDHTNSIEIFLSHHLPIVVFYGST